MAERVTSFLTLCPPVLAPPPPPAVPPPVVAPPIVVVEVVEVEVEVEEYPVKSQTLSSLSEPADTAKEAVFLPRHTADIVKKQERERETSDYNYVGIIILYKDDNCLGIIII